MKAYRYSKISTIVFLFICLIAFCNEQEYEIVGHWTKDDSHAFTVCTKITDLDKLQEFGETMPYNFGKNTTVYFFTEKEQTPDISDWPQESWTWLIIAIRDSEHFANCSAIFDRLSSGDERIIEEPAKYLKDTLF